MSSIDICRCGIWRKPMIVGVIVVYEGIVSGGISVSSTIIVYIYASRLYVVFR